MNLPYLCTLNVFGSEVFNRAFNIYFQTVYKGVNTQIDKKPTVTGVTSSNLPKLHFLIL